MDLPLPVLAFLMVFAAIACTLLLLGLGELTLRFTAVTLRLITALARPLIEASYWAINELIHGAYTLRWTAAYTTQRLLAAPNRHREKVTDKLPLAARLLKSILSGVDRENIIGDLLEEFGLREAKMKSYFWLYKQVITSVCPLIWKAIKNKLTSVFSERVR